MLDMFYVVAQSWKKKKDEFIMRGGVTGLWSTVVWLNCMKAYS